MKNSLIEGNSAYSDAISILYSNFEIENSEFKNNQADANTANLFCFVCDLIVTGSTFTNDQDFK
jgi:hypothetical protein